MVKEPSQMTIVIKNDKELAQWLELVRKEGITIGITEAQTIGHYGMEAIPGQIVTGHRWVVERIEVGESEVTMVIRAATATEEEVQKALSLAGAWKDLDTAAMLHSIYELRHRPETRPPVTFDD